jgi:RNA polymerase sigma-70 factor (ECF subfamily)
MAPVMLVVARSMLRDHAAAEDAVQSTFCRIMLLKRSEIRAISHPKAWMLTVLRREALMKLRTEKRSKQRAEVREQRRSDEPQHDDDRPDIEAIDRIVASLPDHLREIVVLRHAGGLTFDQIAEITQQNRNTAASRYRDAIAKLRITLSTTHMSPATIKVQSPQTAGLSKDKQP